MALNAQQESRLADSVGELKKIIVETFNQEAEVTIQLMTEIGVIEELLSNSETTDTKSDEKNASDEKKDSLESDLKDKEK